MNQQQKDSDTGSRLSCIFLYATEVPFLYSGLIPIAPFVIQTQAIHDRELWLVVWSGSYSVIFTRSNAIMSFYPKGV